MPDAPVLFKTEGHAAFVTLNRPEVLNALNLETHALLTRIWDTVEADDDIWAVVLTGAGNRAFSSGQDLKELGERIRSGSDRRSSFGSAGAPGYPRLTERFGFAKPLIARVNGLALGGGFELALACDIVVAAEHAFFALPEAKLGLIAGAGGVFRLTAQLPTRVALGHLLTGRRMSAAQAHHYGLINDVVPEEKLDECVEGWLNDILACAPLAVRATKQAAYGSMGMPLPQAFGTSFSWEERRRASHDAQEGPLAFTEKRAPRWTGK